jgi:hypothetical protein
MTMKRTYTTFPALAGLLSAALAGAADAADRKFNPPVPAKGLVRGMGLM